MSSSFQALKDSCESTTFGKLLLLVSVLQAGRMTISPCHANILIALTLQSLVNEWEQLESEVSSALPVSYQQELAVYNVHAQAIFLMDIGLAKFFEDENVADKLKF